MQSSSKTNSAILPMRGTLEGVQGKIMIMKMSHEKFKMVIWSNYFFAIKECDDDNIFHYFFASGF